MKQLIIHLTLSTTLVLLVFLLTGCSSTGAPRLVNTLVFSLAGQKEIKVSYDEENITFFESSNEELILMEYMSADKKSCYANVRKRSGSIHISEGGRPLLDPGFERYVEVYLPSSYSSDLIVTTTSGNIDLSALTVDAAKLRIDSTSGALKAGNATAREVFISSTSGQIGCQSITSDSVRLETKSGFITVQSARCEGGLFSAHTTSGTLDFGDIRADEINIETTSGAVSCGSLEGIVSYVTTSGSLTVASAAGSGRYAASNSGLLDINYSNVTGDLSLFNKNEDISLTLPASLEFRFEARSRNGSISTTFADILTIKDGEASGILGSSPPVTISLETNDGNIQVTNQNS